MASVFICSYRHKCSLLLPLIIEKNMLLKNNFSNQWVLKSNNVSFPSEVFLFCLFKKITITFVQILSMNFSLWIEAKLKGGIKWFKYFIAPNVMRFILLIFWSTGSEVDIDGNLSFIVLLILENWQLCLTWKPILTNSVSVNFSTGRPFHVLAFIGTWRTFTKIV